MTLEEKIRYIAIELAAMDGWHNPELGVFTTIGSPMTINSRLIYQADMVQPRPIWTVYADAAGRAIGAYESMLRASKEMG